MNATKIVAVKDNYLGGLSGSVFALPKVQTETPSDYVRRIIAEKGLSHVKVAQRAKALGGELSPGYVNSIIQGHVKSPGVDMVYNLSLGLGEPVEDLLAIYLGQILPDDSTFKRSAFAHESVDKAISLVMDDPALLAEFYDQKSKIYQSSIEKAALLSGQIKQSNHFDGRNKIAPKINRQSGVQSAMQTSETVIRDATPDSPSSPQRTDQMLLTVRENAERIIRDNHELAACLIGLILTVADPNGDPDKYSAADATMAFLFAFTARGEQSYRSYLAELQQADQVTTESELSS